LGGRFEANQRLFEEAKRAFQLALADLESRLQASRTAVATTESRLQKEAAERQRLEEALAAAQRQLQEQSDNSRLETSKLEGARRLEELERKRLEAELLRARHTLTHSARAGDALLNRLRRQLQQPVEDLRQSACRLLQTELPAEQRQLVQTMLEDALLVQTGLREPAAQSAGPGRLEPQTQATTAVPNPQ
jgi:chromosome segregation ATPase